MCSQSKKFYQIFFSIILLALFGLACGGGGGDPKPNPPPVVTYTISGTISGAVTSGVSVTIGGNPVTTTAGGSFTFTGVSNGSYNVTPTMPGFTFNPTSTPVNVNGANVSGVNFVATKVVVYHTVTATSDFGGISAPSSMVVEHGATPSFQIGVIGDKYLVKSVSPGTIPGVYSGGFYTLSPVTSDCSFHINVGSVNDRYVLNWMEMTPNALSDVNFANTPVTIKGGYYGKAKRLEMQHFSAAWFDKTKIIDMVKVACIDDGVIDGEHRFSVTFTTGMDAKLRYYGGTVDYLPLEIIAYDDAGNAIPATVGDLNPQLQLGVVSQSLMTSVTQVGPGVYSASNMINVVSPFVIWEDAYTDTMKKVYQYYPDVFRVGIVHKIGHTRVGNTPHGGPINNQVSGINCPIFNGVAPFGKLSSLVVGTPSGIIFEGLLHETWHSFAFFLSRPDLCLSDGQHIRSPSTLLGQMGNNLTLVEQANGDFLVTLPSDGTNFASRKFANLEKYLGGLIPPAQVGPERFVLDPTVNVSYGSIVPRAKAVLVTIDDIVRVYGPRVPSATDSDKDFPTIYVGLSTRPMTLAEIALVNQVAKYFASDIVDDIPNDQGIMTVRPIPTFSRATGNARMTTLVPNPK